MRTRTYTYLLSAEICDEIEKLIIKLRFEFEERKPYIELGLQELGDERIEMLRLVMNTVQERV